MHYIPRLKVFHKRQSLKPLISDQSDICQQDSSLGKSGLRMGTSVYSDSPSSNSPFPVVKDSSVVFRSTNSIISNCRPVISPTLDQADDDEVEGFAASSFIENRDNFPEFLSNSKTDISSIDTELEYNGLETTGKFKVSYKFS